MKKFLPYENDERVSVVSRWYRMLEVIFASIVIQLYGTKNTPPHDLYLPMELRVEDETQRRQCKMSSSKIIVL